MMLLGFLVGFLEKGTKSAKSGQISGSYAAAEGSHAATLVHAVAWPRGGLDNAWVRRGVAKLCCDVALFTA